MSEPSVFLVLTTYLTYGSLIYQKLSFNQNLYKKGYDVRVEQQIFI